MTDKQHKASTILDPNRPFAVGDRVVCVDGFDPVLPTGSQYTVIELFTSIRGDPRMQITPKNVQSGLGGWSLTRFRHFDHPEAVALLGKMGKADHVCGRPGGPTCVDCPPPPKPAAVVCTCHPLAWLMDGATGCPSGRGLPCAKLPDPWAKRAPEPEKPKPDYRTDGDKRAEKDRLFGDSIGAGLMAWLPQGVYDRFKLKF